MATSLDYPAGPAEVPPDFTRPGGAYRRHAYLAVLGLVVFLAGYLGLATWFAWTSYRMFRHGAVSYAPFWWWVGGAGTGFLALFMFKALVFVRRGKPGHEIEITAEQHPRLFAFLHQVAADAKAPRPHRVYLSPAVNAAVFYDLTIFNLLFPSRKNLIIGLGLINVLNLSELKAVLAHEFGHFAQRSMAVGRWVYTAQQIAAHIVEKRDILDRFLRGVSNFDLRVAWVGWIMRIIVWAIRALVDTMFSIVMLAERALSREMELQADLVAVSLTGSDPLIHALHRLGAADDALDRALAFTGGQQHQGKRVEDLFAIQTEMIARKRHILADPTWGEVPPLTGEPAAQRLFKAQLAMPPQMWSTHPPSTVREDNAKRRYLAAPIDGRSAWTLFEAPEQVRRAVTEWLYLDEDKPTKAVPMSETMAALAKGFDRRYLDPAYRGAYLGRSVVRSAMRVETLCEGVEVPIETPALVAALGELYPASLAVDIEHGDELETEVAMLKAIERGVAEAPGGVIRHRGREYRRRELPALLTSVEAELAAARKVVTDHDRRVRALHLAAARRVGEGWEAQLRGMLAVLHYADHTAADIADAMGALNNVFAVAVADRSISSDEVNQIVAAANGLYDTIAAVYAQARTVDLSPEILEKLDAKSWAEVLGEFRLGRPARENIGDWLDVVGSWVDGTGGPCEALRNLTLEALLAAEETVGIALAAGQTLPPAPLPMRPPSMYATLVIGAERPRQTRLGWWDRFQVADGLGPTILRLAVAGSIVGSVIWASP